MKAVKITTLARYGSFFYFLFLRVDAILNRFNTHHRGAADGLFELPSLYTVHTLQTYNLGTRFCISVVAVGRGRLHRKYDDD